jgi:hypothetical protein
MCNADMGYDALHQQMITNICRLGFADPLFAWTWYFLILNIAMNHIMFQDLVFLILDIARHHGAMLAMNHIMLSSDSTAILDNRSDNHPDYRSPLDS